jgi:integrase
VIETDFYQATIFPGSTVEWAKARSEESRRPVAMGRRIAEFVSEWQQVTPYGAATDWVFPSFKLKGAKPISGSQFVKDYIRPAFIRHGLIDAEYGRAGLHAFRHFVTTVLITEEQVDPKTAQSILRRATPRHHVGHLHACAGGRQAGCSGAIRVAAGAVKNG